jgi:hypothetical protein
MTGDITIPPTVIPAVDRLVAELCRLPEDERDPLILSMPAILATAVVREVRRRDRGAVRKSAMRAASGDYQHPQAVTEMVPAPASAGAATASKKED